MLHTTGMYLGKKVYSILSQSTQLKNEYLALIRQCLELVRYILPATLEYPSGDWNGFRVYRPAKKGRSCEHFGGYKNIYPNTFLQVQGAIILITIPYSAKPTDKLHT